MLQYWLLQQDSENVGLIFTPVVICPLVDISYFVNSQLFCHYVHVITTQTDKQNVRTRT